MTDWRLGTMGFSYSDWSGPFYPAGLKPGDYLAYYARHFNAVELDTTFHATPPPERFRRWAGVTPDNFRFAVKTPRLVTHDLPLEKAADPMRVFIAAARELREKLAVILLQFPPSFGVSNLAALDGFLSAMPGDLNLAVELRHDSWHADVNLAQTSDLLTRHRCAWVAGDYVDAPRPIVVTADFLYVRFVGRHERFAVLGHEQLDVSDRLDFWQSQLQTAPPRVKSVWATFNNDYAGFSVGTAMRLARLLGLSHLTPPNSPLQPTLF